MKNVVLLFILFSTIAGAQNPRQIIDLDSGILNQEILVENDNYDLYIKNQSNFQILEFKMSRGITAFKPLSLPQIATDSTSDVEFQVFDKNGEAIEMKLKDNTTYTFDLKVRQSDSTEVQERKYVFKSQSTWDWSSTFGVNAIFLLNSDTYKTMANGDQFQIVGDSGQDIIEYLPSIMFTFMDRSKNFTIGFSAGLGFDLEQVSAFVGPSIGIGQNFVMTAGVAFHNQQRLDSRYRVNDMVDSSLSFDDLHEGYYRFNPFLSLSFRLDNSPFKSGDE